MKEELEKELFDKYKEMFTYKDDLHASLMKFGFVVGDGWYPLVKGLLELIHHEVITHNKQCDIYNKLVNEKSDLVEKYWKGFDNTKIDFPQVEQVKEKFGGLRFYTGGLPNPIAREIFGAIHFAEMISYTICEECGNKGKVRPKLGWVRTLCYPCYEATVKARKGHFKELLKRGLLSGED